MGDISNADGTPISIGGVDTQQYGMIYVNDGATAQSGIGTSDVKVTGFTTNGPSKGNVTPDVASDEIDVSETGDYECALNMSFSGTANTEFSAHIAINGVLTAIGLHRKLGTGGDSGSAACSGLLAITSGESISAYIRADGASKEITLIDAQLTVKRVG